MFRLYNSHPQANVEHCSGIYSAHSMGSHFVYDGFLHIHKIGHNFVKLAKYYWVYYGFRKFITL
jgi:hypothetical protein